MASTAATTTQWRVCRPPDGGEPYFFNIETGTTVWEVPDGLALSDIPDFTVDDEVFDATNPNPGANLDEREVDYVEVEAEEGDAADVAAADAAAAKSTSATTTKATNGGASTGTGAGSGAGGGAGASASAGGGGGAKEAVPSEWVLTGKPSMVVNMQSEWRQEGEGEDAYYVNTVTGETAWEAPEEDADQSGIAIHFDVEDTVEVSLTNIGLVPSDAIEGDRRDMCGGGADATPLFKRVEALLDLFQSSGTEADWVAAIKANNYWLPHFLFRCWHPATPAELAVLVAQVIILFDNLCQQVSTAIADQTWAPLRWTVAGALAALQAARADGGDSDDAAEIAKRETTWLLFLQMVFVTATKLKSPPKPSELQCKTVCTALVKVLGNSDQSVAMCTASTLARLQALWEYLDAGDSPITTYLAQTTKALVLGENLIELLNSLGYPYADLSSVDNTLCLVIALFSAKRNPGFFYTNDLKVLVDVVLRELSNLPPDDELRVRYLQTLRGIMLDTQWAAEGRYRSSDIAASLEQLTDADTEADEVNSAARRLAMAVLTECEALLDDDDDDDDDGDDDE